MKNNIDFFNELSDIENQLKTEKALNANLKILQSGALESIFPSEEELYNDVQQRMARLGLEASVIDKNIFQKMYSNIKAIFSIDKENWMALKVEDLQYINMNNIKAEDTKADVDFKAVEAWLDRYKYFCLNPERKDKLGKVEKELLAILEELKKTEVVKNKSAYTTFVLAILTIFTAQAMPAIVGLLLISDFYLLGAMMCMMIAEGKAANAIINQRVESGYINAMATIAIALYENGTGDSIKTSFDFSNPSDIKTLNMVRNQFLKIESKTNEIFNQAKDSTLSYKEKTNIVLKIIRNKDIIQSRKMFGLGDTIVNYMNNGLNYRRSYAIQPGDVDNAEVLAVLTDIWTILARMSSDSNKQFKLIIKALHKM